MSRDPTDIVFDRRIAAGIPASLHDAVERAARAQDLSIADFLRASLQDRLARLDVPHERIPPLRIKR